MAARLAPNGRHAEPSLPALADDRLRVCVDSEPNDQQAAAQCLHTHVDRAADAPQARERAGYTVEGLAGLLETTAEAVEARERSGDKMPLEVFYCFCQYLDALPDEILYGPGGPPPRAH